MIEFCGAGSQGITRMGEWLIENTDLVPSCAGPAGWEERSTKEQWCLSELLSPELP